MPSAKVRPAVTSKIVDGSGNWIVDRGLADDSRSQPSPMIIDNWGGAFYARCNNAACVVHIKDSVIKGFGVVSKASNRPS